MKTENIRIGTEFPLDGILTLPDDTVIIPGHGDSTTIGEEKSSNPYFLNLMV